MEVTPVEEGFGNADKNFRPRFGGLMQPQDAGGAEAWFGRTLTKKKAWSNADVADLDGWLRVEMRKRLKLVAVVGEVMYVHGTISPEYVDGVMRKVAAELIAQKGGDPQSPWFGVRSVDLPTAGEWRRAGLGYGEHFGKMSFLVPCVASAAGRDCIIM